MIFNPEANSNTYNKIFKALIVAKLVLTNSKVSSAYYKLNLPVKLKADSLVNRPLLSAKTNILVKASTAKTNKRGERESHCLEPLFEVIMLPHISLRRI